MMSDTGVKRKRRCLTISLKREILDKKENGASINELMEIYNIGKSTLYDVLHSKDKILEYTRSQNCDTSINKKFSRNPSSVILEKNLHEWVLMKRSEGMVVSGPKIVAKAKCLNEDFNLGLDCKFSDGWLRSFKERYRIKQLNIVKKRKSANTEDATWHQSSFRSSLLENGEERISANTHAATQFRSSFQSILLENGFTPDQVYNADETGINWKCLPTKTLASFEEEQATGLKHNKERLTVLVCANVSGQHKLKLLVIGKSAHPHTFKGLAYLPVIYRNQKNVQMSKEIFKDWFFNNFVPSIRENFGKLKKSKNAKCLLLLDNCTSHPYESELVSDCGNIYACHFPPNITSLIQPMNQGVIMSLKCHYKSNFMLKMIHKNSNPLDYQRNFTMKDAVFLLQEAWDAVTFTTFSRAWHHLWTRQANENKVEINEDPLASKSTVAEQGIQTLNKTIELTLDDNPLNDLSCYDLEDWINADSNEHQPCFSDVEDNSSCSSQGEEVHNDELTWISVEKAIEDVIKFMEHKPIFGNKDSMAACMVQRCLASKKLKELKLEEMRNNLKIAMEEYIDRE